MADVKKEKDVDTSHWKIVFSGLTATKVQLSQKFINDLGCQGISNCVDNSITHVVGKTLRPNERPSSYKTFQVV